MCAHFQGLGITSFLDLVMECCFANPQECQNFFERQELVFEKCSAAHVSLFREWSLSRGLLAGEVKVI